MSSKLRHTRMLSIVTIINAFPCFILFLIIMMVLMLILVWYLMVLNVDINVISDGVNVVASVTC